MKLSTERDAFLTQLQIVARVASTRSTIQSLAGIQVAASSDGVELRATDMEVGLRVPLACDVQRDGTVVLPARLFVDVVRSLPAARVSLELRSAEQDVEITSGSATFHIRVLRNEDFPRLAESSSAATVAVPAGTFVSTAQTVARAASRDETRPVLTGVLVSATERTVRMVATDSYRLSVRESRLDEPLASGFEANVPARALAELGRIVGQGAEGEVGIGVGQNQAVFVVDGAVLSTRLIDGQFPNYRQLMPEEYEHELRVDVRELADVVRRISLLAQKNAPLRLGFTAGELTVSAQTPDVGEAREALPVAFDGEPLEIGFNPEFLRDGLESVDSDDLKLKLISPLRPGLIESVDGDGVSYLIMPIRLNV